MRHLASLQTIASIEPIPNAESLEAARVLGWIVVVKKGEYRPGDAVVYCEIDSLLPERPEFEFLRKSSFRPAVDQGDEFRRPAGFRIKTVRLRGQVSQGICFPPSILPPGSPTAIGTDVTEVLGIVKYESPPPVGMGGKVRGPFPGFLAKTDETRVQLLGDVLLAKRGATFGLTEKLDGTSFTAFLRQGRFGVCSRNLELEPTDEGNLHASIARRLNLAEKLETVRAAHGFDAALQGEIIGPGIQGNKYARKGTELHVFTVTNLTTNKRLDRAAQTALLKELGLTEVPDLGTLELRHTVDELVALAEGDSRLNAKCPREGIVLRPPAEEYDSTVGGPLSFKAINPRFLLKFDD